MDKNDIIKYVMHTPHNTNKAVLNSMLNQLSEGAGDSGADCYLGIHAATVDVTFDISEVGTDITAIDSAYLDLVIHSEESDISVVQFSYDSQDYCMPVSELGTLTQMKVPVSEDYPLFINESVITWQTAGGKVMNSTISVVSGNAMQTERGVLITGDCALHIKVVWQE